MASGLVTQVIDARSRLQYRNRERAGGIVMFEGLFQPMHLLVIFVIALLVFGPKKLPELGKGLGEGIRGFKDGLKDQAADPNKNVPPDAKA
jgi:sec-independent protein translocase protein TatA